MSSYATLLEEHFEEEMLSNDTFSNISSCLESLTGFVNEEVNFEMTISLEEAVSGNIKDKAAKISGSVKTAISNLIKKLIAFSEKIADATKRFTTKAKVVIAQCGNEALKKMIGNNKAVIGKDIKVRELKYNGNKGASVVKAIYDQGIKSSVNILSNLAKAAADLEKGEPISINRDTSVIDAMAEDITKSKVGTLTMISSAKNVTVKSAYDEYVGCYLDSVKSMLPTIQSTCNDAKKQASALVKSLKKTENGAEVNAEAIASISAAASDAMKISTYILNYAMSILTIATKNGAKIALAAVDADGKAVVASVKAAPGKAKDAIDAKKAAKEAPAKEVEA